MYQGTLLEFLNMGGSEIVLILGVVLLLFGGKKLPELARGLGKGIREFKDASDGVKREIHRNINAMDLDKEEAEQTVANNNNERHHPTESTFTETATPPVAHEGSDVPYPQSTPIDEKIVTDSQKV
ncbi:twin-arginine translocase TatA/TatE family subunit [Pedobacter jamesrossensis]|uniref:Sec-independent protein translocase protein TatA n=1 Tax=Pedobacter jamesrossensis TaxID=1908238 RepID=A0ABV8NUM0_9SPHI